MKPPTIAIVIVIVTNDIFSTVLPHNVYNGPAPPHKENSSCDFLIYVHLVPSHYLMCAHGETGTSFCFVRVCFFFGFIFVVNKCRIWVFAWLMRARDSSLPLVIAIPGRVFRGCSPPHTHISCLLTFIRKPLHHFANT